MGWSVDVIPAAEISHDACMRSNKCGMIVATKILAATLHFAGELPQFPYFHDSLDVSIGTSFSVV